MNTKKLYALVSAYENIGLSHDSAFERAFQEYKADFVMGRVGDACRKALEEK